MSEIWDVFGYEDVIRETKNTKLPECNRGSWYCPVATESDAQALDYLCRKENINTIYDLGAGTLEFAAEMDSRGYDVIAYETLETLTDFAQARLPDHSVKVRNRDYYADWEDIHTENAAFVAIGKVNSVPGDTPNGIQIDSMSVTKQ